KAAVIRIETRITVARTLTLAKGGAAHIGARLPGPAAHDAFHILAGTGRSLRIDGRTLFVVSGAVNVLAPFGHISVQVENAPSIRLLFSHSVGLVGRIVSEPGVLAKLVRLPKIIRAALASAAGIFPFRFRGKAISIGRIVAIKIRSVF